MKQILRMAAVFFLLNFNASGALAGESPREILQSMSMEEKLGQMFTVFFEGPELSPELTEMIEDFHIGGIILYSISGNIESPAQVAELTASAQRAAAAAGSPGLIVSVDQEGGPVTRLKDGFTVFPPNMAAAAAGPGAVRTKARITAAELSAVGVNMNFAPVADVNVNPDNPIIGVRSYGSDPGEVSKMAAAAVDEYRKAGVGSCAKHFPGHGDTGFDSHVKMPVVPHGRERLEKVELAPFRAAIKAGVPAVMTAHVAVPALTGEPDLPATMSATVLMGVLRDELGFEGLIITDSLGMGALDKRYGIAETAERAFLAGADVLLFGADKGHKPEEQKLAYDYLLAKLKIGLLPESLLDAAVLRILEFKADYGILEPVPADPAAAAERTGTPEHKSAARELARNSITLLRNEHSAFPVRPWEKALVVNFGDADNLPPLIKNAMVLNLPAEPGPGHRRTAQAAADSAEKIVVLLDDAGRHPGQAAAVRELMRPELIIALTGSPYDAALFPGAPCVVAGYSDVPASLEALAEALFGNIEAAGKLPVDLPAAP
jgi:beta-N-acetylhexosaminidase